MMNEIDAVHAKSLAQKALLLDQENAQLKAKIAQLEKSIAYEKECANLVVSGALDIQEDLRAAKERQDTDALLLKMWKENAYGAKSEVERLQADLQAARTAAELAQSHRQALEQLVRSYQQRDNCETQLQWGRDCQCDDCHHANELLGIEVKL